MQRKDSTLLSHTGLKHYYKNDRDTYEKTKIKYLPSKWKDVDFKTEIKELAHNIRTIKKNSLNKYDYHFTGMDSLF